MSYFENLNLDSYNIKTDGKIRNIDGGLRFVPYINGVDDPIYKGCIADLLTLDWGNYKLYLVGGVLEGWATTDIDICITGEIKDDLINLMLEGEKLGCFDLYYVESLEKIKGNTNRIWEFAKHKDRKSLRSTRWNGQWNANGLFYMTEKFPDKGRSYSKQPLLLN